MRQCHECEQWLPVMEFTWRFAKVAKSKWCRDCIREDGERAARMIVARKKVIGDIAKMLGADAWVSIGNPPKRPTGTSRPRREPSQQFVASLINVLGEMTLEEIALAFGAIGNPLTRERVRQIQNDAIDARRWRHLREVA